MNADDAPPAGQNFIAEPHRLSANERTILDLVRNSVSTRADLTRATGLTAQSVSRIVDALVQNDLLQMGDRISHGRGQPSTLVELNPNTLHVIGVSIMTDAVSAALLDFSGQLLASHKLRLRRHSLREIQQTIGRLIDRLQDRAEADPRHLFGLGVGVTGYFTGVRRQFNPPSPLDDLALIDLDELLAEEFCCPVWIDNDGSVAAIGESFAGAGRDYAIFAYLHFAMGVGGGIVINNQIFRGAYGNAGEVAGILRPEFHDDRPTMELLRKEMNAAGHSFETINDMLENFDADAPGVAAWLKRTQPHLQSMMSAISSVFDPEAIVLGGRMPESLARRVIDSLEFYSVPRRDTPKPFPRLLASEVAGDAAAIGAAAMPLKRHFFA